MRSIIVRRLDLTLSNSGLRSGLLKPPSTMPGDGTDGSGGKGGIICTGFGVSLTRTCFTRKPVSAVGGGGNQGWRRLSESDASLSNFFSCAARAIVPRLRPWPSFTGPLVPSTSPRPHLQPSMSFAGAADAPLVRFHRHREVTALKAKSTQRAMLKPQRDLIS